MVAPAFVLVLRATVNYEVLKLRCVGIWTGGHGQIVPSESRFCMGVTLTTDEALTFKAVEQRFVLGTMRAPITDCVTSDVTMTTVARYAVNRRRLFMESMASATIGCG